MPIYAVTMKDYQGGHTICADSFEVTGPKGDLIAHLGSVMVGVFRDWASVTLIDPPKPEG